MINDYDLVNEYTWMNYDHSEQVYGQIRKQNEKIPNFLWNIQIDWKHGLSLECDCRLGWVQDWRRVTILITYDIYVHIFNFKLVWPKCNILKHVFLGRARRARILAS